MTQATYRPRFEVTGRLEHEGFDELDQVIGVSPSTIRISCSEPPGIGTEVELVVHLPTLRSSVHAQGRVAWRSRQHPADMGVTLLSVEAGGQDILARYREQLLAASVER